MMNRSFLSVALAFILTIAAQAGDIVVYKGVAQYVGSLAPNPPPATRRIYFVIDFETGNAGSISYYIKDGKKGFTTPLILHVTRTTSQNVKPITILASADASETDLDSFNFKTLIYRGFDSSLKIATSPVERVIARPRTFKATFLSAFSANSPGQFSEIRYKLAFNSTLTIAANNEPQTVAEVLQKLKDGLIAQGYSFE